jgi:hypothetical protein
MSLAEQEPALARLDGSSWSVPTSRARRSSGARGPLQPVRGPARPPGHADGPLVHDEGNGQWQIASKLRDAVRFEVRSITERPPRPGRFRYHLCRNLAPLFRGTARLAFTGCGFGSRPTAR